MMDFFDEYDRNDEPIWVPIEIPLEVLSTRCNPVVAPLNDKEIAILGGHNSDVYLNDIVLFNIGQESCAKVVEDQSIQFYAFGNQSFTKSMNKIIALVNFQKSDKPSFIEFKRGKT